MGWIERVHASAVRGVAAGHLGSGHVAIPVFVHHLDADDLWPDFCLTDLVPASGALLWVTGRADAQQGMVGIGEAARTSVTGRERFSRAQRWWAQTASEFADPDGALVAFMSFNYEAERGDSAVIVPEHLIRRAGGSVTLATTSPDAAADPQAFIRGLRRGGDGGASHQAVQWRDGALALERWQEQVSRAVGRIEAGALDKVVLARSVIATADAGVDLGWLVARLAAAHSSCWTFLIDGWVGATPEMLVRRSEHRVHSRVLAGTVKRSADEVIDGDLAARLQESGKDLAEHEYAVRSVADVLSAHCTDLDVPEQPSLLRLANVQHLATDVTGELADDTPAVALAGSLHPTAAVCGTTTERAAAVISELEHLDRGRYAAPVGWSDARGDGEYGIALRCGHILDERRTQIELFAGCGIVAGSTAEAERAESEAKFQAMRRALTV